MKPCRPSARPIRQAAIARNRDKYPTGAGAVDQILSVYNSATPDQLTAGLAWYAVGAQQVCADIQAAALAANGKRLFHSQAAGILAALSPATGWGDNVSGAIEHVITGNMNAQTPLFNERARAIYDGADPLTVLGGRKVRSFYRNIADPTAPGAVTIDRHAVSLIFGRPLSERTLKPLTGGVGAYQTAASFYRAAARHIGVLPQQVQAVTWLVWRDANPFRGRNADLAHNTNEPDPDWSF